MRKNALKTSALWLVLLAVCSVLGLQSCDLNDKETETNYPSALVTMKATDNGLLMQVDDSTALYASNLQPSQYPKEVRAFVSFRELNSGEKKNADTRHKTVFVNWVDTIRTKNMAESFKNKNDSAYGKDPLEIVKHWSTVCEDGYLTLRFRTYFGRHSVHVLNLVQGDKPNEVVLHHDAKGDMAGYVYDGVIAFRLDKLPDTKGEKKELILKWKSFKGEKSVKFYYRTRK